MRSRIAGKKCPAESSARQSHRSHPGSDPPGRANTAMRASVNRSARPVPVRRLRILVGANQEDERCLPAEFARRSSQRVDGIAGRRACELALVELESRFARNGKAHHRAAIDGWGERRRRGSGGVPLGHPEHFVDPGLRGRCGPSQGARYGRDRSVPPRIRHGRRQARTSPWPSTTYFCEVRPSRPTGRARAACRSRCRSRRRGRIRSRRRSASRR